MSDVPDFSAFTTSGEFEAFVRRVHADGEPKHFTRSGGRGTAVLYPGGIVKTSIEPTGSVLPSLTSRAQGILGDTA